MLVYSIKRLRKRLTFQCYLYDKNRKLFFNYFFDSLLYILVDIVHILLCEPRKKKSK